MTTDTHSLDDPVIVSARRTPVGRYGGLLATVRPDDLAATVIAAVVADGSINTADIEDVIFGCANQAGEDNRNVGRMAALLAGLPQTVGGVTVNRLCGSGLQAVISAAHAIRAQEGDVFIAGGVESMSRSPYVLEKSSKGFDRSQKLWDTTLGWRFPNPKMESMFPLESMGQTAENVAKEYGVLREDQDAFAINSQRRWAQAHKDGVFFDEIVPVELVDRKGAVTVVDCDEHPRPDTTPEQLGKLKPAFRQDGSVTAGNASGINDGAAALLMTSRRYANEHGLSILATVRTSAVCGVDPRTMGTGPIPAVRKALKRAGLTVDDSDRVELNEAFAAQALACIRTLGLKQDIVNVTGGSIAMGHPLGSTGARLVTTLVHAMQRDTTIRTGLVTMCIGVGQGIATVITSDRD